MELENRQTFKDTDRSLSLIRGSMFLGKSNIKFILRPDQDCDDLVETEL